MDAHAVLVPQPHGDHRRGGGAGCGVAALHRQHGPPAPAEGAARRAAMGPRHGARAPRRERRPLAGPAHRRHHEQRQQHTVHHHRRKPRSNQLPPHTRGGDRPPREAAARHRPPLGGEHAHPGQVLVGQALPHHILRPLGAAQVALLFPLRADHRHHGLHPAGLRGLPLVEARRAEPRVDRTGQGDRPPAGHSHLVTARLDRVSAVATRRSGGRGGDEQGPGPPDEDRGPLLEDRFRDAPHPGQHQRNGG